MITEAGIKAAIRNIAASGNGSIELTDGGGRGEGRLSLTVRLIGGRVTSEWYAKWWRNGKRKLAKLGTYPALSLADVRKTFREDYAPAISAGRDPTGPKVRRERRGITLRDMFDAYLDGIKTKPAWVDARRALIGFDGKGGAAKGIGADLRAADVTTEEIRDYLAEIYARGAVVQADHVRSYIHAAFGAAMKSANSYKDTTAKVKWGITFNPCTAIPSDPEAKRTRDRHLTPAEFRDFWNWLSEPAQSGQTAYALKLQMVIGQRVREILRLTGASFDRAEKMLDWSTTKNGMPHAIPVPPQAETILLDMQVNLHDLYFPHERRPDEPSTSQAVYAMVQRYLKARPSVRRFTPRDLRRTWKTLAGAAGVSKEIRDRIQNHARNDVSSKHYDRYDYLKEKRAGMEMWSAYLSRILAGELDNPVTRLQVAS